MKLTIECRDPGVESIFRAARDVSAEPQVQLDVIRTAARWAEIFQTRLDSNASPDQSCQAAVELELLDSENTRLLHA